MLKKKVKFGESVQSNIIPRLTLADREVKFISILDIERFCEANLHYLKQVGAFHCWRTEDEDGIITEGSCCKIMEQISDDAKGYPSIKYILPVAVYTTKGNNEYDVPLTYCRLELGKKDYNQLLREIEDEGIDFEDITKCVIRVRGVEDGAGQFKRVAPEFKIKSEKNPLMQDNIIKKEVSDFLIRWDELIETSLGKVLDEEKLSRIVKNLKIEEGEITNQPERESKPEPELRDDLDVRGKVEATISSKSKEENFEPIDEVSLDSLEDTFEDFDLSDIIDD